MSKRIIFITMVVTAACLFAVSFFVSFNKKDDVNKTIPAQVNFKTLNTVIREAMAIYASAPYKRYSYDELQKYFSNKVALDILQNYEPLVNKNNEGYFEFEEQECPEIVISKIFFYEGLYEVKLKFGEVYYNYSLTVTPNCLITKVVEGGISFE